MFRVWGLWLREGRGDLLCYLRHVGCCVATTSQECNLAQQPATFAGHRNVRPVLLGVKDVLASSLRISGRVQSFRTVSSFRTEHTR